MSNSNRLEVVTIDKYISGKENFIKDLAANSQIIPTKAAVLLYYSDNESSSA
jgi:hypothetical protein